MTASRPRPLADARSVPGEERSPDPSAADEDFPIVAIGASAGGLEACQKLLDRLPPDAGMAYVVVQHMDPTHGSLLVDLLASHTTMPVSQAADGARPRPDAVYVIAPGTYLSLSGGAFVVIAPEGPRGARLPFDFLLNGLAADCGPRTLCVILSGSLADGSLGLKAVKAAGGCVIAQDPEEAGSEGMPRSAILTGEVDAVLPLAKIPAELAAMARRSSGGAPPPTSAASPRLAGDILADITGLIRDVTGQDFTLYKPGTLQRRIQRRMAMSGVQHDRLDLYLDRLREDPAELAAVAKDLLIHVTSFFRDPRAFDLLAKTIAADLARGHGADTPIRIWAPGCSTGEEAYSIAMIYKEAATAATGEIKLQLFASDMDGEAVAVARDGLYPHTIAESVSAERLARFFVREERGYRVSPELRACVVFTVQNLLADPPFSRIDLISCRNLLIYLRPEAQARAVAIFHFALKPGGVLFLGGSESVGRADGRFSVISKPARLYRQVGGGRPGDLSLPVGGGLLRSLTRPSVALAAAGQSSLAELCRRLVLEAHAPAAVLINRSRECLYTLGPADRYLRVAAGAPSLDILAMARHGIRSKLAHAISEGFEKKDRIVVHGGPVTWAGKLHAFDIEARPVPFAGETLLLLCFLDIAPSRPSTAAAAEEDASRVADLEVELEATRAELHAAVRSLEIAAEEQTTINEEALSVNEEHQSTNEELLTSKEELQSLNEELNALNSQLQETLDRQRTTGADLQNILYSTNVATMFLDKALRIRFFTPTTRNLFNVIPTDVGRPLADLSALAADPDLIPDARLILQGHAPLTREIEGPNGAWHNRTVMPYRTDGHDGEGVVITYADITERKRIARSLEAATLAAETANRAKSRFLAAASHDLRQPLQTLTLIQGMLARKVRSDDERKLIDLQAQCLGAMTGMLNTLLDINQIDAGVIQPTLATFQIGELFDRLRDEFAYHAQSKGLSLRIVRSGLSVVSDPALLEQMIRNLLANAVKYTPKGRVLVGCRRQGDRVMIEIHDSGIGIAAAELQSIFEEYHQIENVARERSRGLGLGLSIVKRLSGVLDHPVTVRSRIDAGSVFVIDVAAATPVPAVARGDGEGSNGSGVPPGRRRAGRVLVVEDDPELRALLEIALAEDGHEVSSAFDGPTALALFAGHAAKPDVVLVDYNLPGGMTGLEVAAELRARMGAAIPVVVLTGDISTGTLRDIDDARCAPLHKPVKPEVLAETLQGMLAGVPLPGPATAHSVVYVVDDDSGVRDAMALVLLGAGLAVETFADCESFVARHRPGSGGCLLLDAYLPGGMTGLELLRTLRAAHDPLPVIMITGEADVRIAVQAMKAGAADFIEKPITAATLLESVERVFDKRRDVGKVVAERAAAAEKVAGLTPRQHQILEMVLAGHPSKNIAADLGISQRTVENHRAAIMRRTGVRSLPALARLALAAAT